MKKYCPSHYKIAICEIQGIGIHIPIHFERVRSIIASTNIPQISHISQAKVYLQGGRGYVIYHSSYYYNGFRRHDLQIASLLRILPYTLSVVQEHTLSRATSKTRTCISRTSVRNRVAKSVVTATRRAARCHAKCNAHALQPPRKGWI